MPETCVSGKRPVMPPVRRWRRSMATMLMREILYPARWMLVLLRVDFLGILEASVVCREPVERIVRIGRFCASKAQMLYGRLIVRMGLDVSRISQSDSDVRIYLLRPACAKQLRSREEIFSHHVLSKDQLPDHIVRSRVSMTLLVQTSLLFAVIYHFRNLGQFLPKEGKDQRCASLVGLCF